MAGKLMHAVQHDQAGLKHVEVPVSSPSKDEVLLKIEAASINPVDWRIRKGLMRLILPRIPRDLIQPFEVCPELLNLGALIPDAYFRHVLLKKYEGGLAEFAAAKESMTVPRPPEVSAAEGAGLPVAALTAHQALTQSAGLKLDGTSTQTNILITAASGGVGHYAVQLAKLGNMHVTATCGARNIDFVKSLGADEVLDYKTPDGEALKSPSGKKYDAVIHCATTGIPWSTFEPNLSSKGKVIDMTPTPIAMLTYVVKKVTFAKKHLVLLFMVPKRDNLDYLVKLVKEGKLKTVIDSRYPLGKAEDAWAKSIDGHATGKIIVDMLD